MRPVPSRKLSIGAAAAFGALVARLRRTRAPADEIAAEEVPKPTAEGEPPPQERDEMSPGEVAELREELRRELERLAGADIKASRTRRESTSPPG
jgi:hypothetical protein